MYFDNCKTLKELGDALEGTLNAGLTLLEACNAAGLRCGGRKYYKNAGRTLSEREKDPWLPVYQGAIACTIRLNHPGVPTDSDPFNGCVRICSWCKNTPKQEITWKPPTDYIGSKEIDTKYNMPRSTLEYREQKDSTITDEIKTNPHTKEKFYPEDWVQKQLKTYKPKRKKP